MKKIVLIISILSVGILLVGCISIPLGDSGKLVISMDGINIEANDVEVLNAEVELEDKDDQQKEDIAQDQEQDTEEETDDQEIEEQDVKGIANSNSCEDDYALILDDMPPNFPMPDCATITKVNSSQSNIDAYYNVKGDWIDIYKMYQNHFGNEITSQSQKPENKSGELHSATEEFDIYIDLSQRDDDFVDVRVLHYFVEAE